MAKAFYNTIHLKGTELSEAVKGALSQEGIIKNYFEAHPEALLTPFEVRAAVSIECISSVRRAMTNLARKGILQKTNVMKNGPYGFPNYCWKLAECVQD